MLFCPLVGELICPSSTTMEDAQTVLKIVVQDLPQTVGVCECASSADEESHQTSATGARGEMAYGRLGFLVGLRGPRGARRS